MGHLLAYDRLHFYQPPLLWDGARLEKNWLFSIDALFFAGSTKDGYNKNHKKVGILNIYGTHNMHALGQGVPNKDLTTNEDLILTLLSRLPSCDCNFANLCFDGTFRTREGDFSIIQNFDYGFFLGAYLPVRSLEISCISYTDLSSSSNAVEPNKNHPIWQAFLTDFNNILSRYDLSICPWKKTGVGDLSILFGWTNNHQDTKFLDFVDTALQIGVLLPTSKKKDLCNAFALPLGYDGHFGLPLVFDLAIGLYEWLTLDAHLDLLFLFNHTKEMRLRTSKEQNGFIKLALGSAKVKPGIRARAGLGITADHFAGGLSAGAAYSYAYKGNDLVTPCDSCFDAFIASDDEMFRYWNMHTLHFKVEYDWTKEGMRIGPRFGLFYNWCMRGKRIFKTNTGGAHFGIDIDFSF